jgi:D-alanyl-D-alanine carboxypeptidase
MPSRPAAQLLNTARIEVWPGGLLRARRNDHARLLVRAEWVLRRKRDGRFLAAIVHGRLQCLQRSRPDAAIADAQREIAKATRRGGAASRAAMLPLTGLRERLAGLGLDQDYGRRSGLALVAEPACLQFAGFDRYARPLWLIAPAASAWRRMRIAARADGVALDAISGYRSHDYQLGIFERKLARGLALAQILAVNAAPGYSEHHGGCALDIGTPGEPPAEEGFEHTPAFDWLQRHAGGFGFVLSYPRGNPHGIVYEPWHWCWRRG